MALVKVRQGKRGVDSGNSLRPTYSFLKGAKRLWLHFWYRRVKRFIARGRGWRWWKSVRAWVFCLGLLFFQVCHYRGLLCSLNGSQPARFPNLGLAKLQVFSQGHKSLYIRNFCPISPAFCKRCLTVGLVLQLRLPFAGQASSSSSLYWDQASLQKKMSFFVWENLEKTCPSDSSCNQGVSPWGWRRCFPSFLQGEGAPVPEGNTSVRRSHGSALRQEWFQASPST